MYEYTIGDITTTTIGMFETLVDELEKTGPIEITKDGKSVAILISYEEYEEIRRTIQDLSELSE
jgi:prevent-host-death family protein